MREWFDSLQSRERVFVFTAAVFVVFAIFYLSIWMPLDRGQKSLSHSVDDWKSALSQLQPLKGQLLSAGSGQPSGGSQSLVVIIDNTLRERGLYSA